MKVSQLIQLLQQQDPDATVYVQEPSHNYWHHQLIKPVMDAEQMAVQEDTYNGCKILKNNGNENVFVITAYAE